MEGDVEQVVIIFCFGLFQSTPSVWRVTSGGTETQETTIAISIHTLRVEGDHPFIMLFLMSTIFQSTPSVWRVTYCHLTYEREYAISIHTLRVEGDSWKKVWNNGSGISIHTLRVEGDIQKRGTVVPHFDISIHTLRVEGDRSENCSKPAVISYFNPHPPCGG